jgi:hypothetical protein
MNYRDDEEFEDFCDYNDIGLPLAYFVSADLVTLNDIAEVYISETFDLLCAALGLPLNEAYDSLELMFEVSKMQQ